ncbi:MAG: response regulator [Chitinophagaceae bacterium]|nr:MAG: response regulator [Chitinophagaceae bacterium]
MYAKGPQLQQIGRKIVASAEVNSYRDIHTQESSQGDHSSDTQSARSGDDGIRALIIEDEVDICYLLKGILRYNNIKADYVTSLSDAEKVLQWQAPPLVFLDNHLGDGLGVNYISKVKTKFPETKVIMITAHDTQADRDLAYKAGVDLFIGKPFTKEIISKAVSSFSL